MRKKNLIQIFGQNVEMIRRGKKLTRKKLSQLCGLTLQEIQKIEKGRGDLSLEKAFRIAKALNHSIARMVQRK